MMFTSRIATLVIVCLIAGSVLVLSSCDELVSILSGGDIVEAPDAVSVGVVLPRTGYLGPGRIWSRCARCGERFLTWRSKRLATRNPRRQS